MNGVTMQSGTIQAQMRWAVVMMPGVHTQAFTFRAAMDRDTTVLEWDGRMICL